MTTLVPAITFKLLLVEWVLKSYQRCHKCRMERIKSDCDWGLCSSILLTESIAPYLLLGCLYLPLSSLCSPSHSPMCLSANVLSLPPFPFAHVFYYTLTFQSASLFFHQRPEFNNVLTLFWTENLSVLWSWLPALMDTPAESSLRHVVKGGIYLTVLFRHMK